jgi:hypothetical protein
LSARRQGSRRHGADGADGANGEWRMAILTRGTKNSEEKILKTQCLYAIVGGEVVHEAK